MEKHRDVTVKELLFKADAINGVPWWEILNIEKIFVMFLRESYRNDPYGLSNYLSQFLLSRGILAAVVPLCKWEEGTEKEDIKFFDVYSPLLAREVETVALVWLGEWVIDPFASSDLFRTEDYVSLVKKYNDDIDVFKPLVNAELFDDRTNEIVDVTLDWLCSYKS